ncbi:MAG: sulfur carrier protein ThiS [Filomicrobium sp.]
MLEITLNGDPAKTTAETLEQLIVELGLSDQRVATAINDEFVAATKRAEQRLSQGDKIEIVSARQGG